MSTIEDYKLQFSYKFGPGGNAMVNVRAQDAEELEKLLAGLVGKGPDIAAASTSLGAVVNLSGAMPGSEVINSPAQTADSTTKTCQHGVMKFISRPDYAGHFCPANRDDPTRCKPVYDRKSK